MFQKCHSLFYTVYINAASHMVVLLIFPQNPHIRNSRMFTGAFDICCDLCCIGMGCVQNHPDSLFLHQTFHIFCSKPLMRNLQTFSPGKQLFSVFRCHTNMCRYFSSCQKFSKLSSFCCTGKNHYFTHSYSLLGSPSFPRYFLSESCR